MRPVYRSHRGAASDAGTVRRVEMRALARYHAGVRIAASLLVLPSLLFGASGCEGDMACIQWSEQEGACPAPDQALLLMKPLCDEPIVSVDGEGEFDGQACCYEVTKEERDACADAPVE